MQCYLILPRHDEHVVFCKRCQLIFSRSLRQADESVDADSVIFWSTCRCCNQTPIGKKFWSSGKPLGKFSRANADAALKSRRQTEKNSVETYSLFVYAHEVYLLQISR